MEYREIAKFPSSSSDKVYTVKEDENGNLSCDCRGWTIKKPGKERSCKHTTAAVLKVGVFPGGGPSQPAPDEPPAPEEGAEDPDRVVGVLMGQIEMRRRHPAQGPVGHSLHEQLREMNEEGGDDDAGHKG